MRVPVHTHYEFYPQDLQLVLVYVNDELIDTHHEAVKNIFIGNYIQDSVINIKIVGEYKHGRKVIIDKDVVVMADPPPLPNALPASDLNRHSIAFWATRCNGGLIVYITGGPFGVIARTHESESLTILPQPPDFAATYYTHTVIDIPLLGVSVTKQVNEMFPGDAKTLVSRTTKFLDVFCSAVVPPDLATITVTVTNHYKDKPPVMTEAVVYIGQSYPYTALSS